MSIFYLPDLGEGLPDAEIHEWYIKEGDDVALDQPIVSMETAKAVVDVPSPQAGKVIKLFGKVGDVIKTGSPLVEFFSATKAVSNDTGTVVGNIQIGNETIQETAKIGKQASASTQTIKAVPAVRMLAKKLNIDLTTITPTGPNQTITLEDVQRATPTITNNFPSEKNSLTEGFEPLQGTRRMMALNMAKSHQEVVSVTLNDDTDITDWPAETDITVRIIRSLIQACQQEPALNAWYDGQHNARKLFKEIHLGIAMDSQEGLFVPVIHNVGQLTDEAIRKQIEIYKQQVEQRNLAAESLKGATITLSNFGNFAGRYANPIIVSPTVAIIGTGKIRYEPALFAESIAIRRILPISLSFDHRAATGGEAARFLKTLLSHLSVV